MKTRLYSLLLNFAKHHEVEFEPDNGKRFRFCSSQCWHCKVTIQCDSISSNIKTLSVSTAQMKKFKQEHPELFI